MKTPLDNRIRRGGAASLTLALALHALAGSASAARAQGAASPQPAATAPKAEPPAALEVTDETGRRVSIPQPVRRIVSLAPSLTESVYALGAQDRLVGVTDYCDYPPEALAKPKVGGAINPNLEQIIALKPDLVLATRALNRRETVEALERLGVAAYATDPRSVEGVLDSTARLGEVLGARESGEALVVSLRARLAELKRALTNRAPRRVLFVVWQEPLISIGRNTFLADALRWAGAESVVDATQDWPHVSLEAVVHLQPEYLVFAGAHGDVTDRNVPALADQPGWRSLDAVRQRRFAVISEAINRPAPRMVDAIEQLAHELHPEAFEAKPEMRNSITENRVAPTRATWEWEEAGACAR